MIHLRLEDLIIGHSAAMTDLRDVIRRAAPRRCPVLIQGPTGAGKELVAQGLHAESGRRGQFVPFNAAAIPEALFESELLGHVRGAFSGAIRDRPGLLRRASCGTAFMDEVGELPVAAQVKLLRVLDSGEVCPVGADSGQRIDFRLVAATNADLAEHVKQGRFRVDLLFRLRGIVITVPALRDHADDVALLAAHFGRAIAAESGGTDIVFTPGAVQRLVAHPWPGNVRELRRSIEYAAFLSDGPTIRESEVMHALASGEERDAIAMPNPKEWADLRDLLDAHAGDVNAVAVALGVDRSTAYRRMQRLGISADSRRGERRDSGRTDAVSRTVSRDNH